ALWARGFALMFGAVPARCFSVVLGSSRRMHGLPLAARRRGRRRAPGGARYCVLLSGARPAHRGNFLLVVALAARGDDFLNGFLGPARGSGLPAVVPRPVASACWRLP